MFSVCVPVYNEEENIRSAYESVRNSDLWRNSREKELIFCINASKDRSEAIAREIAQSDSHVKVLSTQKKGKNNAWHMLVDHANPRSETLFFMDTDVRVDPKAFDILGQELKQDRQLAIAGARFVPENEKHWWSVHRRMLEKVTKRKILGRELYLVGQCYAIRATAARTVRLPTEQRIHEDTFLDVFFSGQVRVIPAAKVYIRLAAYWDHIRQRIRAKASKELLLKIHPELRKSFLERQQKVSVNKLRIVDGFTARDWMGFGMNQMGELIAKYRAKRAVKKGKDTWPKMRSTKSGLRK